jgi:MFS transporter, DHA2 family, multidrug resistance protein
MTDTPISTARKWATLAIGCLAAMVLSIDLTALHLAIPGLIRDLDPSATQILWIADVYGFALAGLLITMGSLGDRIGRRRLLLIGAAAFGAASLLTAYADTPELLIAARALLGIAGATIMPSTLSLVRNVFTEPKERTAAVGIFTGVSGAGVGLGPIVGGLVLDHFWWGAVFLINVPVMALVFVLGLVLIPESRDPRPGRIDLAGVAVSMVGMLGLVYAIKEAARSGVDQVDVAVAAAVGVAGLALFARRQVRRADPVIDMRLFRLAAFTGSVAANLVAMFALVAQSLIFAQYFQLVLGWSPLKAGLAGLPGAAAAMVGGGLAGPLVKVLGRARVVALGMAVAAVGFVVYTATGTESHYLVLLVGMTAVGGGMGFTFAVTTDTMLAAVPKQRAGAASAISETATELGGALGMAILGSVLNAVYRGSLDLSGDLPAGAAQGARDSLGGAIDGAAGLPAALAREVVGAAQHAFVDGMHVAALSSAGLALVAGALALVTLRRVPAVIPDAAPELPRDLAPVSRG